MWTGTCHGAGLPFGFGVVGCFPSGRDDGLQGPGATAVGEDSEVSDPMEAIGNAAHQEPADESIDGQGDGAMGWGPAGMGSRFASADGDA